MKVVGISQNNSMRASKNITELWLSWMGYS